MTYLISGFGKQKEVIIKYGGEEKIIMPKNGFWQIDLATFSNYPKFKTVKVGKQVRSIAERPYGMIFK